MANVIWDEYFTITGVLIQDDSDGPFVWKAMSNPEVYEIYGELDRVRMHVRNYGAYAYEMEDGEPRLNVFGDPIPIPHSQQDIWGMKFTSGFILVVTGYFYNQFYRRHKVVHAKIKKYAEFIFTDRLKEGKQETILDRHEPENTPSGTADV